MYVENSINSSLKRIALKLGIGIYEEENKKGKLVKKTDVHTHMLRGTFATRCAEAKIAPAVLKKILGHVDITVTMQYYVDVDAEFEKSENKNVESYLFDNNIFGIDFNSNDVTIDEDYFIFKDQGGLLSHNIALAYAQAQLGDMVEITDYSDYVLEKNSLEEDTKTYVKSM